MSEFHTYTLPGGIRCLHRRVRTRATHCALMFGAGSRDELPAEQGLAHFTEHALFKGTDRRRAWQVNCRLENVGGELNAYTTKEETVLQATVLGRDTARAVELLADIALRSTFPERELERERQVVIDEIQSYKDSPADCIWDRFEALLFAGSPLAHDILGRPRAVEHFDAAAIRRFRERNHTADRMVFASIGPLSGAHVEQIVRRHLSEATAPSTAAPRTAPRPIDPFEQRVARQLHQTHCIVGARAYDLGDDRRIALSLLVNLLGGPAANSLLNVELRERRGLTYNIEASYTPYVDTGVAAIYFSTERDRTDTCLDVVRTLLDRTIREGVTPRRLAQAKRQYLGQLAIGMEQNENYILGAGKSYLVYHEVEPLDVLCRRIAALTGDELIRAASETFARPSTLIFG